MNSRKNLFIVASALLASAGVGHGELRLTFSTNRTYRQSPVEVVYRDGNLGLRMWDGNWFYGCGRPAPNSIPNFFLPSILCPLGATGYLAAGDIDNDGVRDDFSYWEVITLIPGVALEPNRPDLCRLYSSPPSKLPRPIGVFTDRTDTMFYNLVDPNQPIRVYKLPDYSLQLDFATRTAMDQQVVTGLYQFSFPRLGAPDESLAIPVTHYAMPEGYREMNNVRQGFRFTKLNGNPLAYNAAGFVAMDPRVANTFTWAGNTAGNIFPALDNLYVAISDLVAPVGVGDPTRVVDPNRPTVYPGFFTGLPNKDSRVLLQNALVTEVVIPPGFVNPPIATPNRETVLRLMLERLVPSSTVAYDSSTRDYELPLRFVNTYEGWAAVAFPPGTPASIRVREANPDGDAYTNYIEWRNTAPFPNGSAGTYVSNPMVKNTIPPPVLTFVQARATRSTDEAGASYWETKHTKTAGAYPPISYEYEYSTDMLNWTVIGGDHLDWLVIETDTEIKVRSKHATLTGNGYLRVKSTQAPEPPPATLE